MAEVAIRSGRVADGAALADLGRAVVPATGNECLWPSYVEGDVRAAGFYAQGFVEQHREPDPRYPDRAWMRRDPR